MTLPQSLAVLFCVALISLGQVLFKHVGLLLTSSPNGLNMRILLTTAGAFAIYGLATLIWIYLLRTIPLSKAYPYMALSFVLVPLAAALLFSETINAPYVAGMVLIVAGIIVISRSGA